MSNSNPPRVSVKVPSKERGVTVRVKPPESRLYLMVTSEGEALEVKVCPQGLLVEVLVLPLEEDDSLEGDFTHGQQSQTWPIGPEGSGHAAQGTAKPDSSLIIVESQDLDIFKEITSSSATILAMKLAEPATGAIDGQLPEDLITEGQAEEPGDGISPDIGTVGLGSEGPSLLRHLDGEERLDPESQKLLKVSQTQALLAQLPDLEPVPKADDDSRSGTAYIETVIPGLGPGISSPDPGVPESLPIAAIVESMIDKFIAAQLEPGGESEGRTRVDALGGDQEAHGAALAPAPVAPFETFICEPVPMAGLPSQGQADSHGQAFGPALAKDLTDPFVGEYDTAQSPEFSGLEEEADPELALETGIQGQFGELEDDVIDGQPLG
ncbi:MAG: hypothetical protein LBU69_06505, partial [Deltaproteobacteria bacterium]|nr:hypothetical protein [Deltaproteobacteria bacterium]